MPALLALLLLPACIHPRICHEAAAVPDDGPAFALATEDWGLSDVRGTHLSTADFDGDGFPDLLVTRGTGHTDHAGEEQWVHLLRNTGEGTFEDVTHTSGVLADRDGGETRSFQLGIWGDVNNNGHLDLFTGVWYDRNQEDTYAGQVNEILLNQGDGTFALAEPSDVSFAGALAGAAFVDFDRDGILDLWLVGWYERYGQVHGEQDRLLRGNGDGTFTDVTEERGLAMIRGSATADFTSGQARRPSFGATACDLTGDGQAELLTSVYGRQWNQHWRLEGETYVDVAPETGFAGDDLLDYDDNQFYRCYCTLNDCDPDPGPPAIGDCETFGQYWSPGWDDQPFRLNGNTFTTVCGDLDNDGHQDLFNAEIVHWHIGDSSDPSQILLNDGTGSFTRPGRAATGLERPREGSWDEGDIVAAFLDFDNDGWKDVLLGASDYPDQRAHLWRQVAPGQFQELAVPGGLAHERAVSVAIADFDGDGALDVVFASSTMRSSPWSEPEVHLYENLLGGNHTHLDLVGTTANAAGIGARVIVRTGDLEQTFEVSGGYGHQGLQHTTSVHAGLGEACVVDEVEVHWPDAEGAVTSWRNLPANVPLELHQDGKRRRR